jgi:hypothetical protein
VTSGYPDLGAIRQARPYLFYISPLVYTLCWVFVLFNSSVAYLLFSQKSPPPLVVINSFFTAQVWGAIFLLIALSLALSLVTNAWRYTRINLGLGLFTKAIYLFAFIDLGSRIGYHNVIFTITCWGLAMITQVLMIIFFLPGGKNGVFHAV